MSEKKKKVSKEAVTKQQTERGNLAMDLCIDLTKKWASELPDNRHLDELSKDRSVKGRVEKIEWFCKQKYFAKAKMMTKQDVDTVSKYAQLIDEVAAGEGNDDFLFPQYDVEERDYLEAIQSVNTWMIDILLSTRTNLFGVNDLPAAQAKWTSKLQFCTSV